MSKDRAAPFSRKHRRYWIPVLGGMILIGFINLVIGLISYANQPTPPPPEKIELHLPPPASYIPVDASVPPDVKR